MPINMLVVAIRMVDAYKYHSKTTGDIDPQT